MPRPEIDFRPRRDAQGVDPKSYLAWVLDRRGTWRQRYALPVRQLTPAAYKEALKQGAAGAG